MHKIFFIKRQTEWKGGNAMHFRQNKDMLRQKSKKNMSDYEKLMSRLLKFTADWCGPCKRIAGPIQDLAKKYNVEIETIDIDKDA